MRELSCLKEYDLTLTVRGPVFIGCGVKAGKRDYLYDPRGRTVRFVDQHKLFELLIRKNLADRYEAFMLGREGYLSEFLRRDCGLTQDEISSIVSYSVKVGDALDADHSLKEIHRFIRNAEGQAYVPGSSIKGAVRTALLAQMILQEEAHDLQEKLYEDRYFHTLACLKKNGVPDQRNAVNSIMRGIQISDSLPIPGGHMTLAGKIDVDKSGDTNQLNVCRECIAPGTQINAVLVLDDSILKGRWTAEKISAALEEFMRFQKYMAEPFRLPKGAEPLPDGPFLLLGGGAGYLSKTAAYPFYDEDNGLKFVSETLDRSFRKHNHKDDIDLGVSPRMLKYTGWNGGLYPFGLCEVKLS